MSGSGELLMSDIITNDLTGEDKDWDCSDGCRVLGIS